MQRLPGAQIKKVKHYFLLNHITSSRLMVNSVSCDNAQDSNQAVADFKAVSSLRIDVFKNKKLSPIN